LKVNLIIMETWGLFVWRVVYVVCCGSVFSECHGPVRKWVTRNWCQGKEGGHLCPSLWWIRHSGGHCSSGPRTFPLLPFSSPAFPIIPFPKQLCPV
jgi:hypothetical protein